MSIFTCKPFQGAPFRATSLCIEEHFGVDHPGESIPHRGVFRPANTKPCIFRSNMVM
jgi:hypothetical protein